MSKKYVNGYDKPRFEVVNNNGSITTYNLSFKYQSFKEYYEEIGDVFALPDGRKKKAVDYYDYEWHIDYPEHIEAPDMLALAEIEKASAVGKVIWLTPHIETWYRKYSVIVLPEKREIDMDPHFGGRSKTANRGFRMVFVNRERISQVQTQDADYVPIVTAESYFEF